MRAYLFLHVFGQKQKSLQASADPRCSLCSPCHPIMYPCFAASVLLSALNLIRPGGSFCTAENCRRAMLLAHFGERLPRGACTGCDVCRYPAAVARQVSRAPE